MPVAYFYDRQRKLFHEEQIPAAYPRYEFAEPSEYNMGDEFFCQQCGIDPDSVIPLTPKRRSFRLIRIDGNVLVYHEDL